MRIAGSLTPYLHRFWRLLAQFPSAKSFERPRGFEKGLVYLSSCMLGSSPADPVAIEMRPFPIEHACLPF